MEWDRVGYGVRLFCFAFVRRVVGRLVMFFPLQRVFEDAIVFDRTDGGNPIVVYMLSRTREFKATLLSCYQ